MNPRVLLWLQAAGLQPEDIVRRSGADTPLVTVGGARNLWTVHYVAWMSAKWRAWASSLGYRSTSWRDALRDGHTDADFDVWLDSHHLDAIVTTQPSPKRDRKKDRHVR